MPNQNKNIQLPSKKVLEQLQKDTPDIILPPMSEKDFKKGTEVLEKLHAKERQYHILHSDNFF